MACRCCTLRTVRTKRPARGTLSHPTYIIRNISSLELSSAFRARLSSWALAAQPGPSWIRRPHAVLLPPTARLGPLLPSHPPPPRASRPHSLEASVVLSLLLLRLGIHCLGLAPLSACWRGTSLDPSISLQFLPPPTPIHPLSTARLLAQLHTRTPSRPRRPDDQPGWLNANNPRPLSPPRPVVGARARARASAAPAFGRHWNNTSGSWPAPSTRDSNAIDRPDVDRRPARCSCSDSLGHLDRHVDT